MYENRYGNYLLDMELPGCRESTHLELNDGYLNISAARNSTQEEKDNKGNIIRQERYSGTFLSVVSMLEKTLKKKISRRKL